MHHAARKVKSLVLNDIGVSIGAHYYASQLAPYACRYVAALDAPSSELPGERCQPFRQSTYESAVSRWRMMQGWSSGSYQRPPKRIGTTSPSHPVRELHPLQSPSRIYLRHQSHTFLARHPQLWHQPSSSARSRLSCRRSPMTRRPHHVRA